MPNTRQRRMADLESHVRAGALLPAKYSFAPLAQAASLTVNYDFIAAEEGILRHLGFNIAITGTVTINLLKNAVTVMSAVFTVVNNTNQEFEGLGGDVTGPLRNFNTLSDANLAKLRYSKGDTLRVAIVTAAASTVVSGGVVLTTDERQPESKNSTSPI